MYPNIWSAGSKELITHLRTRCAGIVYHNALSPVAAQQVCVVTSTAIVLFLRERVSEIGGGGGEGGSSFLSSR